ncbi:glycosyltransferase family 9 protein [Terasakiella sp.]|uniref:glycosyltransferase family 9 protein n=1 Tax=Terasakiella sp. TaxID=2034861 RepID=UPI003AA845D6
MKKELTLTEAVAYVLCCLSRGQVQDARNLLMKLPQDNVHVLLAQARLTYVEGDNQRAFEMTNQLLSTKEAPCEAMAFVCYLLAKTGETAKVRPILARLEEKTSSSPQYWGDLAVVFYMGKNYVAALQCAQRSLKGDPDRVEIWRVQGAAQRDSGNPRAAISSYFRALSLDPMHGESYLHLHVFFEEIGEFDKAAHFLNLAKSYGIKNQQLALRDAHVLLKQGRLKEGFQKYRVRYDGVKISNSRPECRVPVWNGEEITDKDILVYCEQGAGDVIQFSRFLIELAARGAKVTFLCRKSLCRLIAHAIPQITVCETVENPDAFDYQSYLMDLAIFMDISVQRMPHREGYLRAPYDGFQDLPKNKKPKIGFAWHGGAAHLRDHLRSIDLGQFADLFTLAHLDWVSLQVDANAPLPKVDHLIDVTNRLQDFGDTAALIAQLDLVISVDTAIAHLAAAMGKPVWLLLDQCADWRWQEETTHSYWYDSIRLFRQQEFGNWKQVLKTVQTTLREEYS